MFRALVASFGLFAFLAGVAFVGIDRVTLTDLGARAVDGAIGEDSNGPTRKAAADGSLVDATRAWLRSRVGPDPAEPEKAAVDPPDWFGYAGVSLGFVTLLYAAAMPSPKNDKKR